MWTDLASYLIQIGGGSSFGGQGQAESLFGLVLQKRIFQDHGQIEDGVDGTLSCSFVDQIEAALLGGDVARRNYNLNTVRLPKSGGN
jgi:hypothetical protein